ncbi:MAG: hypothetical protein LBV07_06505 [Syntrophobacterales bacterium]|jgi:hypothetical protein|nr:hypothetical protein [Syntrophobacterales bacterium]
MLFKDIVKKKDDLSCYAGQVKGREDFAKRYDVIYCCEYLGYLDASCAKVGCLLHPLQNDGEDMRHVSFYGQELCAGHFCPSYHYLSQEESLALIRILDDWYLYGLCVTDIDLVKTWFRLIAEAVHEMPSPEKFSQGILREISRDFFRLKISWPYRSHDTNRLGKYYFDGAQYMIKAIDYAALGRETSRFNALFLSLTSEFRDRAEIEEAEILIQGYIDAFAGHYEGTAGYL